jgi:hypothetical protein
MTTEALFPLYTQHDIDQNAEIIREHYGKIFDHKPKSKRKFNELICKLAGYPGGFQQYQELREDGLLMTIASGVAKTLSNKHEIKTLVVYSRHKSTVTTFLYSIRQINHDSVHAPDTLIKHPKLGYVGMVFDAALIVDSIDLDMVISCVKWDVENWEGDNKKILGVEQVDFWASKDGQEGEYVADIPYPMTSQQLNEHMESIVTDHIEQGYTSVGFTQNW